MMRRPASETLALARELMNLAREGEGENRARLAIAHRALGWSVQISGKFAEADKLFVAGAELADSASDHEFLVYGEHPGMICRTYGGQARCIIGFGEQGVLLANAGLAHARRRRDPKSLAWALVSAGIVHLHLRNLPEFETLSREAIEVASEHRLPQWLAEGQAGVGKALCSRGDPQAGISQQEEGIRSLHAAGSMHQATRLRTYFAESLIHIGELEKARVQLEASRGHLMAYGEAHYAAELERVEADLLRAEGTPSETVAAQLKKAIGTARNQGARLFELRAATTLARLWRDEGRRAEARALLAPIYGWFTEGFAMPDLREAKALLDELADPS